MFKKYSKIGSVLILMGSALNVYADTFIVERSFDKSKHVKGDAYCKAVKDSVIDNYMKTTDLNYLKDEITINNSNIKKIGMGNYFAYIVDIDSRSKCKKLAKSLKKIPIKTNKTLKIENLLWEDTDNTFKDYTFNEANEYCNNLVLNDFKDWRLPTIKELFTITDYSNIKPATRLEFSYSKAFADYWSSTKLVQSDKKEQWVLSAYKGRITTDKVTEKNNVRCIRNINTIEKH